jgi:hypothetical protein
MSSSVVKPAEMPLQPVRLALDVGLEQSNAQLRLAAAAVAAVAGIWLAWVEHGVWMRLTALVSVVFAVLWVRRFLKAARVAQHADSHFLEIATQHVTLARGAQPRVIPFAQVERIELDEDRLVAVLHLHSGEELAIEPVYGGLGLRDLGETLQRYLTAQHA